MNFEKSRNERSERDSAYALKYSGCLSRPAHGFPLLGPSITENQSIGMTKLDDLADTKRLYGDRFYGLPQALTALPVAAEAGAMVEATASKSLEENSVRAAVSIPDWPKR